MKVIIRDKRQSCKAIFLLIKFLFCHIFIVSLKLESKRGPRKKRLTRKYKVRLKQTVLIECHLIFTLFHHIGEVCKGLLSVKLKPFNVKYYNLI